MLVDASHDEVSRTRRPRHIGRFYVPEKSSWAKLLSMIDEKHDTLPDASSYQISEPRTRIPVVKAKTGGGGGIAPAGRGNGAGLT
jgi:hypothetical protein